MTKIFEFKMLNGKFEIHTFENISQNAYSKDDDIEKSFFYEGIGLTNITIDPHFEIENEMREAAKNLDFERAMELRDILFELKSE